MFKFFKPLMIISLWREKKLKNCIPSHCLVKAPKANLYEVEALYGFACTWYFISHERNEVENEFCTKIILKSWCSNSRCLSFCCWLCLAICRVIIWSSNSTTRRKLKRTENVFTWKFTAALFKMAKKWKQPKYPSTDEWINKSWYIHTVNVIQP